MDTNKLTGIVVYTIHDKDALRDNLRIGLKHEMDAEELNESTYGIAICGHKRDDVINRINNVCDEASKNSGQDFEKNDFVSIYWPTHAEETGKERFIKQTVIRS